MLLNWIDALIGCVIVRGLYTGKKAGILAELFKLLGTVITTIIALHYYVRAGRWFHDVTLVPEAYSEIFAFGVLSIGIYYLFSIISEYWTSLFEIEFLDVINKWGGSLVALSRAFLISGLLWLSLLISGYPVLVGNANSSLSGFFFKEISAVIYLNGYLGVIHPFFAEEPLNEKVLNLVQIKT